MGAVYRTKGAKAKLEDKMLAKEIITNCLIIPVLGFKYLAQHLGGTKFYAPHINKKGQPMAKYHRLSQERSKEIPLENTLQRKLTS